MNSNPVAIGINSLRNDPRFVIDEKSPGTKSGIYSYHAERVAIRRAGNCEGGTLYVVRLANGRGRMSAPCDRCMTAIENAGIKKIVFTTNSGIAVTRIGVSNV